MSVTPEERERARFEQAISFAWVLWHAGLTASSVFRLLGELLRRSEDPPTGAEVRIQVSDHGVTVLGKKPHDADLRSGP